LSEGVKALGAAARFEPYVMYARHHHTAVRRRLQFEVVTRRPDLLYLDHLDGLSYASSHGDLPIVIDMHNVYSQLAARAAAEADIMQRPYLVYQASLLARMEERAARIAHTILAVSEADAAYFARLGAARVIVVPNGVDCDRYADSPCGQRKDPPTLLYVGTLSWPPNAHAAQFLGTDVLPRVRERIPNARLAIVGKEPTEELLALARSNEHITVSGNVHDVGPYFRAAHVLAVPLQAGGGTRLKILEAFAAGCPVVSTPVGCEGLAARDGEHLLVRDRSAFADAVVDILLNVDAAARRAQRARQLACERFDWMVVGARASQAVESAAIHSGRGTRPAAAMAHAQGDTR
jgi:glycosyltransferase involved in cell wall biosynthesis